MFERGPQVVSQGEARGRVAQTLAHPLAMDWSGGDPFTTWEMGGCFAPVEHLGERL